MRSPRHTLDPYADVSPLLEGGQLEVEHRFLVADAGRFTAIVERHLPEQIHDQERPANHVLTTYFDTDDRRLFRAGESTRRCRVRVRQYASAEDGGPPVLGRLCAFELKEATDGSRRKARIVATPVDIERLLHRDGWLGDLDPAAPLFRAASAIGTGVLRPTLSTTFGRRAFTGPGLRVTVDDGIQFAAPWRIGRPGELATPGGVFSRLPQQVIEVKLQLSPPDWLEAAMRELQLAERFSKYRDGLLALQRIEALAAAATTRRRVEPTQFEFEPTRS
jgi:hypothetical protein